MAVTATISIDNNDNDYVFTTNDTIQGKAVIDVTDSVDVSEVEITLQGLSQTIIPYEDMYVTKKGKIHTDRSGCVVNEHRMLSESITVFPAPNEREVMTSSEYTLVAGRYEYPFSFRLPEINVCNENSDINLKKRCPDTFTKIQERGKLGNGSLKFPTQLSRPENAHITTILPPTFSFGDAVTIDYLVEIHVKKPLKLSKDVRVTELFPFVPSTMPAIHDNQLRSTRSYFSPIGNKKSTPSCYFEICLDSPFLVPGELATFSLGLGCESDSDRSNLPQIFLNHIEVKLVGTTEIRTIEKGWSNLILNRATASDNVTLISNDLGQFRLNLQTDVSKDRPNYVSIPSKMYSCFVPLEVVSSFESCNVERSYNLEISISYDIEKSFQAPKTGLFSRLKSKLGRRTVHIVSEKVFVFNQRQLDSISKR